MAAVSAPRAAALLALAGLLFASNVVIGRGAAGHVGPFTLAFFRWLLATAILLALHGRALGDSLPTLRREPVRLLLMAFLSVVVCGGVFYLALTMTSATNGTLIYTASSVFIVLIERIAFGRRIAGREAIGLVLALLGVAVIVLRGRPEALLALSFGPGDLLVLAAALAWAVYSLVVRAPALAVLPSGAVFTAVAATGTLLLLPMAAVENLVAPQLPATLAAWASILGLAVFSSVGAFSVYQHTVRVAGASVAGFSLLLMTPFGVVMAIAFLGERPASFHLVGMALVMAGVVLATVRR